MPCAGPRHLPKQGLPLASSSSLCGGHTWDLLLAVGSCLHLAVLTQPPSPGSLFPPRAPAGPAHNGPPLSSHRGFSRPFQPGAPACFAHPFEALTGSQWSWPRVPGAGLVSGLAPEPWQPRLPRWLPGPGRPGPEHVYGDRSAWVFVSAGMDSHPGLLAGLFSHTESFLRFPRGEALSRAHGPCSRRELWQEGPGRVLSL